MDQQNHSATPMPSASYAVATHTIKSDGTADSTTYIDRPNDRGRGIRVILKTTVVGAGGTVLVTILGRALNGTTHTLLAGASVTTNTTKVYEVFPAATVTANVSANSFLPQYWDITVVVGTNAVTLSVDIDILT